MTPFCARLFRLSLLVVLLLGMPQGAFAYNVPGSARAVVPEITEIATGMIVHSLKDAVRPARQGGAAMQVSSMGAGPLAVSASSGGRTPLSFGLALRDVDTAQLDGTIRSGSLLLGHDTGNGLILFGGLIGETGDLRTPRDNGKISHDGYGLALGLDYRISSQVYLTGILGAMSLDYDVMRGGGAVTGSFGANRQFLDLSADYLGAAAGGELRLGAGLLYIHQKNDGYVESGGAAVAPFSFDTLDLTFGARDTWGRAGEIRPYLDVSGRGRLNGRVTVAGLGTAEEPGWNARLASGIEYVTAGTHLDLSLGANFGEDDFEGLDARLSCSLRF